MFGHISKNKKGRIEMSSKLFLLANTSLKKYGWGNKIPNFLKVEIVLAVLCLYISKDSLGILKLAETMV